MNAFQHSTTVQRLLDLIRNDDPAAAEVLIAHTQDRLLRIARRMFRRQPKLRDVGETDDVLQAAMLRLLNTLHNLKPATVRDYFRLAQQQVRWVLGDLARELAKRPDIAVGDSTGGPDPEGEPATLLAWSDFHDAVARLPEDERAVFEAIFYGGMSQDETATLLELAVRTVKRRWRSARLLLHTAMHGEHPELR